MSVYEDPDNSEDQETRRRFVNPERSEKDSFATLPVDDEERLELGREDDELAAAIRRDFTQAQKTLMERRFGRGRDSDPSGEQDRLISRYEFAPLEARVVELEKTLKDLLRKLQRLERTTGDVVGASPENATPALVQTPSDEVDEPEFRIETTCDLRCLNRLLRFLRDLFPEEERAINVIPVWKKEQN